MPEISLGWIAWVIGALVLLFAIQVVHLVAVVTWSDLQTNGLRYYGRSPAGRAHFRAILKRHARLLAPILFALSRTSKFAFGRATFTYDGLPGPRGTCGPESFGRGMGYEPTAQDVFVVSQMRSGTTWLQQLIYEVLHRGEGTLVDTGTPLYAVSPWLEALKSVQVEDAPLLGRDRPSRLIKTHFPVSHCPFAEQARYIYIARHPGSCFASCVDFLTANAGPFELDHREVERWFCSERMWWGPWPNHVARWRTRAGEEDNVLFLRFEELVDDLADVAGRVAAFLGLPPLSDEQLDRVLERAGFPYMQRHAEVFEMHPPHLLTLDAELFVKGTRDRHRDVPVERRERIVAWCDRVLSDYDLGVEKLFPEVSATRF